MSPPQLKTRLERALHRRITSAEWRQLQLRGLVDEYLNNPFGLSDEEHWREFKDSARRELELLRCFREDENRQQTDPVGDAEPEHTVSYQADALGDPEDPVFARGSALGALNDLRSGGSAPPRSLLHGTLLPRGGVDDTVPQWVHVIAVELWYPAERVMETHRSMQRTLMAEGEPPRTRVRAFNVARFVWEVEKHYGKRLPWRVMCQKWNDSPLTEPFKDWRDFRKNFTRGAKATPPRYIATGEEITRQVRGATARGRAVAFDDWVRQVQAATVQKPEYIS